MEEEVNNNLKNHEEEVQLRLKFETKLNNMHALHRDLETKYDRACQEIVQFEQNKKQLASILQEQKTQIVDLQSQKIDHESKIVYQQERIRGLTNETELKKK